MQLQWAIKEAEKHGVALDAKLEDLDCMLEKHLVRYKGIRLDDGVTGADLSRPGLMACLTDAKSDVTISHVFIHMPDRLARPEYSEDGVAIENQFTSASVTVVFSTRISRPRRRGQRDVTDSIQRVMDYERSGEFRDQLAVRIIETQRRLASQGYWMGGKAPYGFKRVRVYADGTEEDLADGKSISSPGSHTELRVADPEKIRVWLMMADWCRRLDWGTKRIANELNARGIPSPDSGLFRTENQHRHRVSGRWSPSTVLALLTNKTIIGMLQYGVQSEGDCRRLGKDGPRFLEDSDYGDGEKVRTVRNAPDVVVTSPLKGVAPQLAPEDFADCQRTLEERGRNQRGIARSKDPSKYPLSTRVFDLDCALPMYGRSSGLRTLYTCSAYLRDQSCNHNSFDAEALFAFVSGQLRQGMDTGGGRELVIRRLRQKAAAAASDPRLDQKVQLDYLQKQFTALDEEISLIGANLSRAKNDLQHVLIGKELDRAAEKRVQLTRQIDIAKSGIKTSHFDPESEVEVAISLLDQIERILSDPEGRMEFRALLKRLNIFVWLKFKKGLKGSRPVRLLNSGIITTGNAKLPVRPYEGSLEVYDANSKCGDMWSPPEAMAAIPPARHPQPEEGVSYTMVNRGDKIRTCDLLVPNQAL